MNAPVQHTAIRPDARATTVDPTVMSGAEVLLRVLQDAGVEVIFGYPGGAVLPIYDALFRQDRIRHVLVRHEQAAVHAAEAYARSTGKVGVVLVTSGPGGTNTVTGLMDALLDSIPVVCFTGQVGVPLIGTDAFQEADITGITRPATKFNYLVRHPQDIAPVVQEAFHIARTGRPGPVLVDLPKNLMVGPAPYIESAPVLHPSYRPRFEPDRAAVAQAVAAMKKARRPLFYTGGGVINSGPKAAGALGRLVRMTGFPCTSTLMGLGGFPTTDPQFLGMLGMHGSYEANLATHDCDVLVALGSRFDDRVTGRLDAFSPGSFKIHADIDPAQIGKIVPVDLGLVGDAGRVIEMMIEEWERTPTPAPQAADLEKWWAQIAEWRGRDSFGFRQDMAPSAIIRPQYAISRLYEMTRKTGRDTYVSTEVGQHQMWAAQHFQFDRPNHWLTSGGLGTMGYGLPAAVGAQIAHPDALVIDIAGEASTLMNIQELGTIAQYRLPVKLFILNNEYMGMVRQWQELLHDSRYSESYSAALPDFVRLAESFHGRGLRATCVGELDGVIADMLAHPGPVVADIHVAQEENCYPMIPSGAAHNQMLLGPDQDDGVEVSAEGRMLV
ncbi:biosynthetic-type acetolactate synthase large subunit [Gluconacetobacter entanii]|uniref:Acetolactate synthase n=1 Tax=Gluconacetobacter entanii TaxID=108528 RepID=A0ABT3K179_9PROT|nr:biosynthetic-type acetolactate synthase large subunit [Gluconacetobacter entanii]MBE7619245.1 biosynthetic-type acetolactate synthase large subunit [Komagataeibacter sp. FXV2]MBY4640599.1 biosynthetic-type acetolactate synthase large subunit [Gluconacetobacter entanii]MCW4579083.1 biosynthetic-type acetolactate synthase large subunit [Gluconacetobacter entanii]MCW4582483.1 biosynthetic-type acetolactate synthase large subunit [Gluconacetobacter entanii]MCW4585867.1 biosynthetic-type acetola